MHNLPSVNATNIRWAAPGVGFSLPTSRDLTSVEKPGTASSNSDRAVLSYLTKERLAEDYPSYKPPTAWRFVDPEALVSHELLEPPHFSIAVEDGSLWEAPEESGAIHESFSDQIFQEWLLASTNGGVQERVLTR